MPDEAPEVGYEVVDVTEATEIRGGQVIDVARISIRTIPSGIEWSFTLPRERLTVNSVQAAARAWALQLEAVRGLSESAGG